MHRVVAEPIACGARKRSGTTTDWAAAEGWVVEIMLLYRNIMSVHGQPRLEGAARSSTAGMMPDEQRMRRTEDEADTPGNARGGRAGGVAPGVGTRIVADQAGMAGAVRSRQARAWVGAGGGRGGMMGLGGVAVELGEGFGQADTEALRPEAQEEPGEQMGGEDGENPLQAGEQADGRITGLLAWQAPGFWWGVVHAW